MTIAPLSLDEHSDALAALFAAAADYVELETGAPPNRSTIIDFFEDSPPGIGPEDLRHFGLWQGGHLGAALAMSFGYPEPSDCYVGLLIVDADVRGQGFGPRLLAHGTLAARQAGAVRQLIAVLDANPKGRAFWEREGFQLDQTFPPGEDGHIRHRMARSL